MREVTIQWIRQTCEQRVLIGVSHEPYTQCSRRAKKREMLIPWRVWESFPGQVVFELGIEI